jgi:NitT/TauT family transport system permease protein
MTLKASMRRRLKGALQVVLILLGFALLWQAAVTVLHIPSFLLPSVTALLSAFGDDWAFYLSNMAFTLRTTVLGFLGALVLGVTLAMLIVSSSVLDRIIMTFLSALHNVPKVALAPLFVIWMGTGQAPKVAIAIMISTFTIVIDTVVGLKSADPELVNMAQSRRAGRLRILTMIRMPSALPNLFGALKAASSFALIGAVVGEFVGGEEGLGYIIMTAQGSFETERAFVAVALLGLTGTLLYYLIAFAEAKALPWHVAHRGRSTT